MNIEFQQDVTPYLSQLELTRLGEESEAGLWITSLPWPRTASRDLGLDSRVASVLPLGQWPGEPEGTPRRLLIIADGGNSAPQQIALSTEVPVNTVSVARIGAEMELFERGPHEEYVWERHLLRLRHGQKSIGLALGLRTGDEVHWWEACRLVVLEETASCIVVEMGGAISRVHMEWDEFKSYPGLTNPLLHKHNWLNGRLYVRLHANGVCEIFAHHINSRFFDDGLDLEDVVPVVGFHAPPGAGEAPLPETWDGSQDELLIGGVRFDLTEAARLATPEQPGDVGRDGDWVVWQPYQGMELYGGDCPTQLTGDPFIYKAEDRTVPRGMARTLRFSLSLSDRSPRVVRYLAPAWWYGACEEFLPAPLLPVSNRYDAKADLATEWLLRHMHHGGFEDGSIARYAPPVPTDGHGDAPGRPEPGWEGEVPYALFLRAWRTGDETEYLAALRSAYYCVDVATDHASKMMRMHGYPPAAFSVPMNRMQGAIAAFLETGDPYLFDAARDVVLNSYAVHKNSWPRLAVGRDAYFARGALLLYRYFADDFYRKLVLEIAHDVAESQRPNGSFGDQGGGSGIHQWSGHMTKPWMGLTAVGPVLDYLELFPDEPRLLGCVRKLAGWFMEERFDHDGIRTWAFQHDYDGKRFTYNPILGMILLPGTDKWHQESLGRLLLFCAQRFDEPAFFDAWAESYEVEPKFHDHSSSLALQFIPWVQAHLWQARLSQHGEDGCIRVAPFDLGPRTPPKATVLGPHGPVPVSLKGHENTKK